jgi:hypothetical protein
MGLSLSEKVPRLFFPWSATRIGAGHVARPEGEEKIVVEESEATPAGLQKRAHRRRQHSDPERATAGIRAWRNGSRRSRRSVNIVPPEAGRGIDCAR